MSVKRDPLMQVDGALMSYLDSLLREASDTGSERTRDPADIATTRPPPEPEDLAARAGGACREAAAATSAAERACPFKALLFEVGGVTLAVPLDRVAGVIESRGEFDTGSETPPHVLGQLARQGRRVRVVDTGQLIGGQGAPRFRARADGYVVLLGRGDYGLICDQIREMVDVDPAGVRWRRGGTQCLWFTGIITERMCALLDVDELTGHLARWE